MAKNSKPKEKYVEIMLPRIKNDDTPLFVSVNGRTYHIKRGVKVMVPASVAEVIANSFDLQDKAEERRLRLINSANING